MTFRTVERAHRPPASRNPLESSDRSRKTAVRLNIVPLKSIAKSELLRTLSRVHREIRNIIIVVGSIVTTLQSRRVCTRALYASLAPPQNITSCTFLRRRQIGSVRPTGRSDTAFFVRLIENDPPERDVTSASKSRGES